MEPNAAGVFKEPDLSSDEKRLLQAASDGDGQVLIIKSLNTFSVQANGENFAEDNPRSKARWEGVVSRLLAAGYLNQRNEQLHEITSDGYARADKEKASLPLELRLSFSGTAEKQLLSVESNKSIIIREIELLTSSGAHVSTQDVTSSSNKNHSILLDHSKIVILNNAPRSDKNSYDNSGPAKLRLTFELNGNRNEAVLPIMLQPKYLANHLWIVLSGSERFTFRF